MVDERIAARRQELRTQRRRRRLVRTAIVAAGLALVAGVVGLDLSGLVDVERVEVRGIGQLTEAEVVAAADVDTTMLRLRPRRVAERVEALPLVLEAQVRRTGHDRIRIEVEERLPVLQVRGRGEEVLVDRDGVVIREGSHAGLPVIELRRAPPEPGATVSANAALENAHAVWRGLSGSLRADVERYIAHTTDDLTIVLSRGVPIRFGRAERIDEKVRAIGAVLGDIGDVPVEYVDVRAPSAPVIVPD